MSAVCLLDTSVFVEILDVPNKANDHQGNFQCFKDKISCDEIVFLPVATILETGNHIAQNGDGHQRRQCADRFVDFVAKALSAELPFIAIDFPDIERMQQWLATFPDSATAGNGFGDMSIIKDWERLCALNTGRRVYIWSLDAHLSSYDQPARI